MESVQDRVERGAAWLDNQFQGWRHIVDPDELDMEVCSLDVRTLITGEQVKIGVSEEETAWEFAHGFWPDHEEEWAELTKVWRDQLV